MKVRKQKLENKHLTANDAKHVLAAALSTDY